MYNYLELKLRISVYETKHVVFLEHVIQQIGLNERKSKKVFIKMFGMLFSLKFITKTYLYNFDPFKPHFYIVKLDFTELCFLFLLKNIDCGYSLEPPCRGGSNEYPQSMF